MELQRLQAELGRFVRSTIDSSVLAKCSSRIMSPLRGLDVFFGVFRGLTPTATDISPLRGWLGCQIFVLIALSDLKYCLLAMRYQIFVATERKEAILDPQGKATQHALSTLGMNQIGDVRIGKFIRLDVNASSQEEARTIAERSSDELLANPIMETYRIVEIREMA